MSCKCGDDCACKKSGNIGEVVSVDTQYTSPSSLNRPEPAPNSNGFPHMWDLVVADMIERNGVGLLKYGTHLQPFNGRDALADAYQEILDAAVYLRTLIYERDHR